MKLIIFILILFYNINSVVYSQVSDTLMWRENKPLTWNDFKIKKKKRVNITSTRLFVAINVSYQNIPLTNKLQYKVEAVAFPYKSWSVVKFENDYGLKHEQLHFDIAKLYAIKIENKLKGNSDIKRIQIIFDSIYNEFRNEQSLYDKETTHSILVYKQKLWEFKIHKELQKYGYYKEMLDINKCKIFHNGTYKYEFEGDTVSVIRNDSIQFVTYKQSGTKLKQKIKWLNDCTFLVYHTEYIYLPELTNKFPDEKILVRIIEIKDNMYKVEYVSDKYNQLMNIEMSKVKRSY